MSRTTHTKSARGFSLVELLVAIGIISVLASLLLPAIQQVREQTRSLDCRNRLKQLDLAHHLFHDSFRSLPIGHESGRGSHRYQTWLAKLLPYVEQNSLHFAIEESYSLSPYPFNTAIHQHFSKPVSHFACPSDERSLTSQFPRSEILVGLTNYVGVSGVTSIRKDGCLFIDSKIRFADVTDGLSNTLLIAERPASSDAWIGWWYAGVVVVNDNFALDSVLGAEDLNPFDLETLKANCPEGPYRFQYSNVGEKCNSFHYWSFHSGGANFGFADGSIRFIPYSTDKLVVRQLATRNLGEVAVAEL